MSLAEKVLNRLSAIKDEPSRWESNKSFLKESEPLKKNRLEKICVS